MRQPPGLKQFSDYPVVGMTIIMAAVVSIAYWYKIDISLLFANVDVRRGQLLRLVTSVLPHTNLMHLAFNAYWIWAFGTIIEEKLGHFKTLIIFILLAIAGNGSEYAFLVGGIGLSGVGYGLFGLLWALSKRDPRFVDAMDRRTVGLFVIWFFVCVLLTVLNIMPIGNVAHGMGAMAGALLGWAIGQFGARRWVGFSAVGLLLALVIVASTVARPWINVSKYGGDEEGRLAYEALMDDRNQEALDWYRDAIRMQPRNAIFWNNRGVALKRLGQHAEAKVAFKRAQELADANPEYQAAFEEARETNATQKSGSDH